MESDIEKYELIGVDITGGRSSSKSNEKLVKKTQLTTLDQIHKNGKTYLEEVLDILIAIKKDLKKPNILVLKADTGSGKSTRFPREAAEKLMVRVDLLEPYILTVLGLSSFLLTKGLVLGETLAYSTSLEKVAFNHNDNRGLFICTINTLNNMIFKTISVIILENFELLTQQELINKIADSLAKEYSNKVIIIDEVHIKSPEIETLLFFSKMFITILGKKSPFIVITSATMDENEYLEYFGCTRDHFVYVPGRQNDIEMLYISEEERSTKLALKKIFTNLDKREDIKNILIVAPTLKVIQEINETLLSIIQSLDKFKTYSIIMYSSAIADDDTRKSMNKEGNKIIISTNAIETGVTISDLSYVIDLGKMKTIFLDPYLESEVEIKNSIISSSMMKQRCGRTGRTNKGYCHLMYSKKAVNSMMSYDIPALIKSDPSSFYLKILVIKHYLNLDFDFMTTLPRNMIEYCYRLYYLTGMIPESYLSLQFLSATMISVNAFRSITASIGYKISPLDLIIITTWLDGNYRFPDKLKVTFIIDSIIVILLLYKSFCKNLISDGLNDYLKFFLDLNQRVQYFTTEKFFSRNIQLVREDSFDSLCPKELTLDNIGSFNFTDNKHQNFLNYISSIKQCLFDGYRNKIFTRIFGTTYYTNITKTIKISPFKQLENDKLPYYIICPKVMYTSRRSKFYMFLTSNICVLDGFVKVPTELLMDRPSRKIFIAQKDSSDFINKYNKYLLILPALKNI